MDFTAVHLGLIRAWWNFMLIAAVLAGVATALDRRTPWPHKVLDFFVRWWLGGVLIWTSVILIWGFSEVAGQRLLFEWAPLAAAFEYMTVWGAFFTLIITMLFAAIALIIRAIFE